MEETAPQPKVIRMHHEHFIAMRHDDEWALAVDLDVEVGERIIVTPFTKSGHGGNEARLEVIEHPDGPGNGTAFRVTSIITPMRMGGKPWRNAKELLTIERDGSFH